MTFPSGYKNVFHMTIGNDCCSIGDRVPGVWVINNEVLIAFAIGGNGNFYKNFAIEKNTWTEIDVSQKQSMDGQYRYTIMINGEEKFTIVNTDPREFNNVKLFASDPWFDSFDGKIRMIAVCTKGDC